jgi:hypothetical protein
MPALNDLSARQAVKIVCVAKQGHGKTCSIAPLVAAGYHIRMLDFDKGADTLINLLSDKDHFPYANYCLKHNIDLSQTTSFISIDQKMTAGKVNRIQKDPKGKVLKTEEITLLTPADTEAFTNTVNSLMNWNDDGRDLGNAYSWGTDTVLIIDTAKTMARFGYYHHQKLNGRLGAIEDGYDHQRDVGGAQSHVRRIIEVLFSKAVKCNVIVFSHIDWIDESKGFAQTPQERARHDLPLNLEGMPTIIGQALSPKVGAYFNNVFLIRADGNGSNVQRKIWTVPTDRVHCKRSGWLKDSYNTTTGMAEIFSQLNGKPLPPDFLEALGTTTPDPPSVSASGNSQTPRPGSTSRPAPLNL